MNSLPNEILIIIFNKLNLKERNAVNLVCKKWFEIMSIESLAAKFPLNVNSYIIMNLAEKNNKAAQLKDDFIRQPFPSISCDILDLKKSNRDVDDFDFSYYGEAVKEIIIRNCFNYLDMKYEFFKILFNCPNFTTIIVEKPSHFSDIEYLNKLPAMFKNLKKMIIKRLCVRIDRIDRIDHIDRIDRIDLYKNYFNSDLFGILEKNFYNSLKLVNYDCLNKKINFENIYYLEWDLSSNTTSIESSQSQLQIRHLTLFHNLTVLKLVAKDFKCSLLHGNMFNLNFKLKKLVLGRLCMNCYENLLMKFKNLEKIRLVDKNFTLFKVFTHTPEGGFNPNCKGGGGDDDVDDDDDGDDFEGKIDTNDPKYYKLKQCLPFWAKQLLYLIFIYNNSFNIRLYKRSMERYDYL